MHSHNDTNFSHHSTSSHVSSLPSQNTNVNISSPFINVTNSPVPMPPRISAPYLRLQSPLIIKKTVSHIPRRATQTRESYTNIRPMAATNRPSTLHTTASFSPFADCNSRDGLSSTFSSPFTIAYSASPITSDQNRCMVILERTSALPNFNERVRRLLENNDGQDRHLPDNNDAREGLARRMDRDNCRGRGRDGGRPARQKDGINKTQTSPLYI
ncbi:unnamed protein product [Mytilus coruscus]|uniref:Uncharacterized protein n=1 Tax=Mytilus coruscus TaxID=42192 RepID=A0A6J8AN26_MYTCO|nr:unnamed protein product [Mytilus coruscus]